MLVICVPCQLEYRCEKNDFVVEQLGTGLWKTDKWKCPGCGHEIIPAPRSSQRPYIECFEPNYARIRKLDPPGIVI